MRAPLNRIAGAADVLLTDEDDEGNEIELQASVWFRSCPAEPDVGISSAYPEVLGVSTWIEPFGEILFRHAEHHEDAIYEAADEAVYDERYDW